jgi:sterol desaturase/sphingolipid hydroxylase (fatty acid hydroxylase superfamily)
VIGFETVVWYMKSNPPSNISTCIEATTVFLPGYRALILYPSTPTMDAVTDTWRRVVVAYNPHAIDVVGTLLVQIVFWWLPCVVYVSLDALWPSFSERHKIQPAPRQPSAAEVRHCAAVSLRNQVLIVGLQAALAAAAALRGDPPLLRVAAKLPSVAEFARDIVVSVLAREVLFYYAHRLFHVRSLYVRIHKVHHKVCVLAPCLHATPCRREEFLTLLG